MNNTSKIMLIGLFLLVFALINPVSAQIPIKNYEIKYYIEDSSVRENIAIELSTNTPTTTFVSGRIRDVDVRDSYGELDYEIVNENGSYVWDIFLKNDTKLFISFYSDDMIFRNNDISQFFSELSIDTHVDKLEIYVFLPAGNTVVSFHPKNGETVTDGKNIGVHWKYENSDNLFLPLSIKFQGAKTDVIPYILVFIFIIIIALVVSYYRRRVHREFLSGFFEDEKKVVKYLMGKKSTYQNRVEKEFKFSRAKMTRIVKKLEQRGLVKKEKRGRTNKLEWKR